MSTRSNSTKIASCSSTNRFPMIEWILISPSPFFWKLNVDMTFVDTKNEKVKKLINSSSPRSPSASSAAATETSSEISENENQNDIGRFIIVTFQSQSASLAPDAISSSESSTTATTCPETEINENSNNNKEKEEEQEESKEKENENDNTSTKNKQESNLKSGDTLMFGEAVTEWKDLCRENVLAFARVLKQKLEQNSVAEEKEESTTTNSSTNSYYPHWFDTVDPATGQPFYSTIGPSLYSETDSIEQLIRLPIVTVGVGNSVCRLIQHPKYGLDCYPASMFFVGSKKLILESLASL